MMIVTLVFKHWSKPSLPVLSPNLLVEVVTQMTTSNQ